MQTQATTVSETAIPEKTKKRYWFRLIRFFLIATLIGAMFMPVCLGVMSVTVLVYASCAERGTLPDDYGATTWETFTIEASAGGSFSGYYIEGNNGATVIFPPNFSAGRDNRLAEASVLIKHGYSVVTFESRRCADMGPISLGYQEVDEVGDVLAYLRDRGDVDFSRIGIHGFSSAGATAIMAAARYPEIQAVVAEGGYADMDALLEDQTSDFPFFVGTYSWSMRQTYQAIIGDSLETLNPLTVINTIAPRPILLVYGSKEVSLEGGKAQQQAAGDNAELWIVEGAGHGGYLRVAPEEYERRMVAFFEDALLKN